MYRLFVKEHVFNKEKHNKRDKKQLNHGVVSRLVRVATKYSQYWPWNKKRYSNVQAPYKRTIPDIYNETNSGIPLYTLRSTNKSSKNHPKIREN